MAFEGLSDKLAAVFKRLKSKGKLSESDVKLAMREVRLALLEADVNYKVVKDFVSKVSERCVGAEVLESLTPAQQVIKIVNEELCGLMGNGNARIHFPSKPPCIVMMCGLQGAGKTTTVAKLAAKFKEKGKKPLLVACDIYRPAAIEQLQINGQKQGVEVFSMGDKNSPVNIAKAAMEHAAKNDFNIVIIDTAGRLHNKKNLMEELRKIDRVIEREYADAYRENLLVLDATTGQNALSQLREFKDVMDITGIILTKMDGTAKGGIAIAIQTEFGVPVKYIGVGEHIEDLQKFNSEDYVNAIFDVPEGEDN